MLYIFPVNYDHEQTCKIPQALLEDVHYITIWTLLNPIKAVYGHFRTFFICIKHHSHLHLQKYLKVAMLTMCLSIFDRKVIILRITVIYIMGEWLRSEWDSNPHAPSYPVVRLYT